MGNSPSSKVHTIHHDIIHTIPPNKRVEYLVFRYIQSSIKGTLNIPDDIRFLCMQYLQNMKIQSITEIVAEYNRCKDRHKICLLGAGAVGMSAIVTRLILHQFPDYYDPTIEDFYTHNMVVDGVQDTLDILDTAGQEDFKEMWPGWIKENEAFILCYSVISRNTFHHVDTLWASILAVKGADSDDVYQPVAVLCGNKSDLDYLREVSTNEGMEKARKWNIPFVETSARTGENIDLLFETAVKQIRARKEQSVRGLQ